MAKKTSYHHGDLRGALLDAAKATLESTGVHALNLRTLARGLGVSEAAPYHHFRGKDGLIAALAEQGFRTLAARMDAASRRAQEPSEQLREVGRAYVQFALDEPGWFRVMFGAHIANLPDDLVPREAGGEVYGHLQRCCAAVAEAQGRPQRAVSMERAAWSVAHGVATLLLERELRPQETGDMANDVVDAVLDVVIAGIER